MIEIAIGLVVLIYGILMGIGFYIGGILSDMAVKKIEERYK